MTRRRRANKFKKKLILIFVLLIVLVVGIRQTSARYSSSGKSSAKVDVAFYLLNEEKLSETIALEEMMPSDTEEYEYTFSVANYKEDERTEVALKYTIAIRMTTNLPLTYELYMNEGTTNLFEGYATDTDSDGTYFKTITSSEETFGFTTNQINTYKLKVKFPMQYNSIEYQGIIEALEIKVNSEQIV